MDKKLHEENDDKHHGKLNLKKTFISLSVIILVAITAVSFMTTSPSFSKYVLEPIQYAVNITAAKIFNVTPITAIGPISGSTGAGKTLTAGVITPYEATVTYQWKKSLSVDGFYSDIPGATSNTYELTNNENNYYIKVSATGTGDFSGTVTSIHVGPVIEADVPLTAIGGITGTGYDGQQLTAGYITPSEAIVTYQWQRCQTVNGTYINIPGATSKTYIPSASDVDYFIKVVATGSGIYTGNVSAYIGPIKSTTTPIMSIGSITGTTIVGNTLAAGLIVPSDATVSYQWLSCETANGIYTEIPDATNSAYVVQDTDEGKYLRVSATGTGQYSKTVISAYTGPVTPESVQLLNITSIGVMGGEARVGATLVAGPITPSKATVTYQWKISESASGEYNNIQNAMKSTYTLAPGDYCKYLKLEATGSGVYTGTVTSVCKGPVAAQVLISIGNISGTTKVGETLMADTVEPYDATVTYQWSRSRYSGGSYSNISGADGSTYTLTASDIGYYLKVSATGTGAYSDTVTSKHTGPVTSIDSGTSNNITGISSVTGITQVNGRLTAGTLKPYNSTATYQWQRSDSYGGPYTNIPGATSQSYFVKPVDKGYYIRVIATGSGSYTGTVISLPTDPITACPISSIGKIVGTAEVGQTLAAGVLTPLDATADYQWLVSDASYGPYSEILGATGSLYDIRLEDNNKYFKVRASGKGSYLGTVTSDYTGPVTTTATVLTSISKPVGNLQVSQTARVGTLKPSGATATYQWQGSLTGEEGTFIDIPGASSATYTFSDNDFGHYFRVVAAGASSYTGTVISPIIGPIQACSLTDVSKIIGTTAVGHTLTAGTVSPHNAIVSYQWQKSDSYTGVYTDIEGATSTTYIPCLTEEGYFIRLAVTGKGAYSGTVYSMFTGPVVDPKHITGISSILGELSGTPQVGQELSAGVLSPANATATYKWMKSTTSDGTFTEIPGATSDCYLLGADDFNYYIKLEATGSGVYYGKVSSPPSGPVEPCPITSIGAISGTTSTDQILKAGTLTPLESTVDYQWMKSDAWDGIYQNIEGAVSNIYELTEADVGSYIKLTVTGKDAYTASITSDYTGPVTASITPITDIGSISGTQQVEQILSAGKVYPDGATATYQWQLSSDGTNYEDIAGATSSNYKLTANDYNKYIRVVANGSGIYCGSKISSATGLISPCPIFSISNINGVAKRGNILTTGQIYPLGATVTYQWLSTTENHKAFPDEPYKPISDASSSDYVVNVNAGNYIRLQVTGTGAYTGTITSNYIGPVTAEGAGIDITAISPVTGSTRIGGTLTAGVLSPPTATATYHWQRSLTLGGTYANIPGASNKTYTTTENDINCYVRVVATGSGAYSNEIISSPVGPITLIPITSMGGISGTTITGETLTAGSLMPNGATASYQWMRANEADGVYTNISGATSKTYKVTTADNGKYLKVTINGTGSYFGTFSSLPTGPVSTSVTPIESVGTISGQPQVAQVLTAGPVMGPDGLAIATYQWQVSSDGGQNYSNIPGATFSSYTISADNVDMVIRVAATGSGVFIGTVYSEKTSVVTACPITAISPITGSVKEGELLTAGTVSPPGAIVSYQWKRAYSSGGPYTNIPGATSNTFLVPEGYYKEFIMLEVTGINGYTNTVTSSSAGPVTKTVPGEGHNLTTITAMAPISGINQIGQTLTAGTLTPSYATATYQWLRSPDIEGVYEEIHGATSNTFVIRNQDEGYYFKVVATGTNEYTGSIISGKTDQIVAEFTQITAISNIVGSTVAGSILTAGNMTPEGATVDYQWLIEDSVNSDTYINISGADSETYNVMENDIGKRIKVKTTAKGIYSGTVTSNEVGPVTAASTVLNSIGSITGTACVGETLEIVDLQPADATVTYEWYITTEPDRGLFSTILGANSSSYTLTPNEYNYYIKVIVTGTGSYSGSVSTYKTVKVAKREISGFDAIPDVSAGSVESPLYADEAAVIAALPVSVTADSGMITVPVISWSDTDSYNPSVAGSYTFTAVLGEIPAGYANSGSYTAIVEVVVLPSF